MCIRKEQYKEVRVIILYVCSVYKATDMQYL